MEYARYAELTLEIRRREAAESARRAPLSREIPKLRALLLQHLDAHEAVRQPLPGGDTIKRMVSTTTKVVTADALQQALMQALQHAQAQHAQAQHAGMVKEFKTALLKQLKVTHVYADIVKSGGKQDKSRCYAGECSLDEMCTLPELGAGHPVQVTVDQLRACRAALNVEVGRTEPSTETEVSVAKLEELRKEHGELGVMVMQQLKVAGTQTLQVGQRRISLRFRQTNRKPSVSAKVCAAQLTVTLARIRQQHSGALVPELIEAALRQSLDAHVLANTITIESAGLTMHR
jgi:hypothetical protein